jgi:acetyltransferase-like isoleucine patch superfamily enzyme
MQKARLYVNKYRWLAGLANLVSRYILAVEWLLMFMAGKIPLHFIRHFVYRLFGLELGEGSVVYGGAELRAPHKIKIGHHSLIGHQAILDGRGELVIGNNVNFSTGVWIWTAQHNMDEPYFRVEHGKVVIEDYAWVSCRTVILPGTRIGEGAVVAAGAVVKGDIPPYSVVGGVPAKVIGQRNRDLKYTLDKPLPFI